MKLSYNIYPFLRLADKQTIEKFGHTIYSQQLILNPKTEEDIYINQVIKLLYIDGLLLNKPIYYLALSYLEQVFKFSEKKNLGINGDVFYIKDNILYTKTDLIQELEECIIITPSQLVFIHHRNQDNHYFLGFNKDGILFGYCMIDGKGNHICYDRKDGTLSAQIEKVIIITLILKKYGEVELLFVKAGTKKKANNVDKGKIINETGIDVTLLDSRWFREIIRTEGFKVSGHFRLQPYKDKNGEWKRKLIYINEFEKHGYHRHPLIEKLIKYSTILKKTQSV